MNDNSDLLPNLTHEDAFEMQMRGYSRRQVDEFIARCRSQIRDLEQRLARSLDDTEELKRDLATARQQALGAKPAHEEVSERIAQILKLADDEARSQKSKAHEEIARQRNEAQSDADKSRAEAREQAERAITSARAEADNTLTSARAEAERVTGDAKKKADSALASAKAQAKKALDEATARATAIHDGAERRLNLLSSRHSETIKRLTDILDGVSALVAAETARLSLEDEVDAATAKAIAAADSAGGTRPAQAQPGPSGPTGPNGSTGPRPGTSQPGTSQPGTSQPGAAQPGAAQPAAGTAARSASLTAPQPVLSSSMAPPASAQSAQAQDKRPAARAAVLDSGERTENIRVVPGSDN